MNRRQFTAARVAAAVALGLLCSTAGAASNVTRNGVLWAETFEGDVAALTASTPAWAVFDVANSNAATTDGDIRTYTTTNEAGANSYEFAGASWTGAGTQRTAEIRLRVPNDGQYEALDGQGSFIVGVGDALDFRFFNGQLKYNFSTGLANIATLDTSAFHIYRVTYDQAASPQVNLYIDGNTTPAFSTDDQWFTAFDKLVFGDISTGGEAGKLDVDYISWASGVHAPVPEPSSLALLAIGGAAMLRRRK
jgi:hypothetical protein